MSWSFIARNFIRPHCKSEINKVGFFFKLVFCVREMDIESTTGNKMNFYFIRSFIESSTASVRSFLEHNNIQTKLDNSSNGTTTLLVQCQSRTVLAPISILEGVSIVDDFECQLIDGTDSDDSASC